MDEIFVPLGATYRLCNNGMGVMPNEFNVHTGGGGIQS